MCRSAALAVVVVMALAKPRTAHTAPDDAAVDRKAGFSAPLENLARVTRPSARELEALEQDARRLRSLPLLQLQLEKRVAFAPADRALWGSLARVQVWRGQFEAARGSMRKAHLATLPGLPEAPQASRSSVAVDASKPRPRTAADFTRLAEDHLAAGDDVKAQQLFAKALAMNASFAPAHLGLGEMHYRQGRRGLAEKAWRDMTAPMQPRWRGQLDLAEILLSHDMLTEAEMTLNAVTGLPHNAEQEQWQLRAKLAAKRGDVPAAVKWWNEVIAAATTDEQGEYARLQVIAVIQTAKPAEQKQALEALARGSSPDKVTRTVLLARVQAALNAPDKSLTLLEELQAPSDLRVLRAALEIFAAGNRVAEALKWLSRFERDGVALPAAQRAMLLLEMSRLERKRGDLATAEHRVQQALALVREHRIVLEHAAIAELRVAEDAEAITRAEQALFNDPQSERSWMEVLLRHGWLQKAWASGADLSALPYLLDVCSVDNCLRDVEQWLATKAPPTEEADELHIAVAARWHRLQVSQTLTNAPAWDEVADATLAPLQRTFARAPAPSSLAIELAGQLQRAELIAPLVRYAPKAIVAKQYEHAALALLSLGSLQAVQVFDESIWAPALASGADHRVTRALLWAIGAVRHPSDSGSGPVELKAALLRLAESATSEDKPFVFWALRAFADQAVSDRLRQAFVDPNQAQVTAAMALDSWLSLQGSAAAAGGGFSNDAQLPALFATAQASATPFTGGMCALWHMALRSATPTSEAALGVLLTPRREPTRAPSLRQLEAWPQTWVGGEGAMARAWDSELVRAAMTRDSFWTGCHPTSFAQTADSLSLTRAAIRLATAWQGAPVNAADSAELAGLQKLTLWGPPCARAPAVFLRDAWGAPVAPLEVERALDAGDGAACAASWTVRWLVPAVRRLTTSTGKARNDVCQRLSAEHAKNVAVRRALRAAVGGNCP